MRRRKLTIAAASTLLSACALLSGAGDLTVGADGADDGGERDAASDGRGDGLVIEDAPARDAAGDALFDASRDVDADAPAVVDLGPPCLSAVACRRVVFVTSASVLGNFGSNAQGDAKCNALAALSTIAAVRAKTFVAWLSDDFNPVSGRIVHGSGNYVRVDGAIVATSYDDLVDGTIAAPINLDESGGPHLADVVWTGTEANGAANTKDCMSWQSLGGSSVAMSGLTNEVNSRWTADTAQSCGAAAHRLYCVEQ